MSTLYSFPAHDVIVIDEPFFPRESECVICSKPLQNAKLGIAMFEGLPVPHDWPGEWGGFDACRDCFEKHERGELQCWKIEQCPERSRR